MRICQPWGGFLVFCVGLAWQRMLFLYYDFMQAVMVNCGSCDVSQIVCFLKGTCFLFVYYERIFYPWHHSEGVSFGVHVNRYIVCLDLMLIRILHCFLSFIIFLVSCRF